ncbi:MAG: coiled-coil domain-containing protein [Lachnospiraceae bacterium]|jgi:cell wall-associated NlpC family hydrolase
MKKTLLCILLSISLIASTALSVSADRKSELREQKAAAEQQLSDTNNTLDILSQQQMEVQSQISEYNADIVDLMVQIDQAKADIETTEGLIADKEEEIRVTEQDLEEAEETRDKQYQDMKKRIQFIYEQGGDIGWATTVLASEDITSFFNKAEYTEKLHSYDREQLQNYVETVQTISALKIRLEEEKQTLKEQKSGLESQKAALEANEADLEAKLAEAEAQNANYGNQIAEARSQADQIIALIAQTQAEIERIEEEERRAAEEAARQAAAAEAARQAAAEAARQAAASSSSSSSSSGSSGSYNTYDEDDEGSYGSGGSSGDEIVAYADRFVGYPYVWGGNSLTGGIDCSHFVYQVLKNCGVYSGGYYTSGGWAYLGRSVGSLSEARAGDVIVYSGHVAIYDGYGGIVEAKGSAWGITHDRSADCKPIVAIRRFT